MMPKERAASAVALALVALSGCQGAAPEDQELLPVACVLAGESSEQFQVLPGQTASTSVAGTELYVDYGTGGFPSGDLAFLLVVLHEDAEAYRALYQFDRTGSQLSEAPFRGEHGFTGLSYLATTDGQVQFYCATSEAQDEAS